MSPKQETTTSLDEYIYSDYYADGTDYITDWIDLDKTLFDQILKVVRKTYDVASFSSLFLNSFHLFILTRKGLRNQNIYIIMIGICLCDILQSLGNITKLFMNWSIVYVIEDPCYGAVKKSHLIVNVVTKSMQIMTRRCSSFLALYMAIFRALSLIFPFSRAITRFMSVTFTALVMMLTSVVFGAWGFVYGIQVKFERRMYCQFRRTSYMTYSLVTGEEWEIIYLFYDGCIALFVSVSYILVALSLLWAIRKARKRRNSLGHVESTDRTSGLISVMAITMFISETIYGLLWVIQYKFIYGYNEQYEYEQLDGVALTLLIINSTVHSVFCFFLSSQYRSTVVSMFCRGNRVNPFVSSSQQSPHNSG